MTKYYIVKEVNGIEVHRTEITMNKRDKSTGRFTRKPRKEFRKESRSAQRRPTWRRAFVLIKDL